jgi:hypothetical protein
MIWANCATADCPNKACTWADDPERCFPCGERRLGRAAMIAAFNRTHPITWEQAVAANDEDDDDEA